MAPRASASEKTDVLYMRNGDRLTCEIKSLNAGSLDVKLDYVDGTISVEWSEVERLDSKRLFSSPWTTAPCTAGAVDRGDAARRAGAAADHDRVGRATPSIDKTHIVEVLKTSDQFWQRFAVDLSSGVIYSKGNQSTQYNISTQVTYPTAALGREPGLQLVPVQEFRGHGLDPQRSSSLTAYHLLPWKNYFYAGQVGFLQSTEQGIDVRTNVGGGIGKYVKHSSQVSLALLGGLGWQNTQYAPTANPEGTQDVLALLLNGSLRVVTFSRTNITLSVNALPALSAARPLLLQHQRQPLRQAVQQPEAQPVVLRQLGHGAARDLLRQRLRPQFGAGLDLRQQLDTAMTAHMIALGVFGSLFGAALLGMRVRAWLPDHHLGTEAKDSVRVAMATVATMAALVLGLLVASTKGTYDAERNETTQLAARIIYLDRVLAMYGPETATARSELRQATVGHDRPDVAGGARRGGARTEREVE